MSARSPTMTPAAMLIMAALAAYGAWFIARTGFAIGGTRYYALFDDGMISMRFASNLAEGRGLVYNAGERIEGFTNPLWTFLMAAVHLAGVAKPVTSLVVQIVSLLGLVALVPWVGRLARAVGGSTAAATVAMALSAFFFPLNFWALQGMEVGMVALIATVAVTLAVEHARNRTFSWTPHLLMGLGTLVRLDMAGLYLALVVGWCFADSTLWKRHLKALGIVLLVFLGGQTLARLAYYGEPLPNTYYLKMTGSPMFVRIKRGLVELARYVWDTNLLVWIAPFAGALALGLRRFLPALALIAAGPAYSAYVGGDAWEFWVIANRFITPVMPAFFAVLAVVGATGIEALLRQGVPTRWQAVARPVALFAGTAVVFAGFNLTIYGGPSRYAVGQYLRTDECERVKFNRIATEYAFVLEKYAGPKASVLIFKGGTTPYFLDRYMVDGLGKADTRISKMKAVPGWGFRPGHTKWDYAYAIGDRKPDIIAEIWPQGEAEALAAMGNDYETIRDGGFEFHVRRGSPNVLRPATATANGRG